MAASVGDSCENVGFTDFFTSPCCYAEFFGKRDHCPSCGAPVKCSVEYVRAARCTIIEETADD
jgi:hypothetical protein